jgi:phosphoribosylformimino-5-aminoimidazole carboxamide ribotide isomerase
MRLRPCIDIHDGAVKQIVGSTLCDASEDNLSQNFVSAESAAYYAGLYREKNLPGGHIILLNSRADAAQYEADKKTALSALSAYPGGMQVGGGITPDTAAEFLDAGASHIIVTSYVFRDGQLDMDRLNEMISATGKDHLVLDLSCKRAQTGEYVVVTDRWQKKTELIIAEDTLEQLSDCCDEFLIHAADVEGKRGGIEEDLVRILGNWQKRTAFPIIYAGGVHTLADIDKIRELSQGRMDFTVGSALNLFGGSLDLDELVNYVASGK